MIVLGIDPGYAIVGVGVVEYKNSRFSLVSYGAITTDAGVPFNRRLEIIYDELTEIKGFRGLPPKPAAARNPF